MGGFSEYVMTALAIAGAFGWIMKTWLTLPLLTAINALRKVIEEMRETLQDEQRMRRDLQSKSIVLEQTIKTAHHRIDESNIRIAKLESQSRERIGDH